MQLPDDVYSAVTALCKVGDERARQGDSEGAKQKYIEALKLLPGEHRDWATATWIYAALGDVHFKSGAWEKAFKCFFNAVQCPGGLGNPFIHLRLGQIYLELNDHEKAADELTRAYMGGGMDAFVNEDAKYLDFLATKIQI